MMDERPYHGDQCNGETIWGEGKKRDVHTRQRAQIFTTKQNNYQWLLLVKEMVGMGLNLTHFYVL